MHGLGTNRSRFLLQNAHLAGDPAEPDFHLRKQGCTWQKLSVLGQVRIFIGFNLRRQSVLIICGHSRPALHCRYSRTLSHVIVCTDSIVRLPARSHGHVRSRPPEVGEKAPSLFHSIRVSRADLGFFATLRRPPAPSPRPGPANPPGRPRANRSTRTAPPQN
eukprot:2379756-Pyramimonas_sp.AAC.1